MAIDVTVLGCSGTYAGASEACSGYLVDAGGFRILLDCGPGTLANLQKSMLLEEIDAVVISHCHPDHWLELPILRNALRYILLRTGLPVYPTSETLGMAEAISGFELGPTFDWSLVTGGDDIKIGPCRVRFARTDHPPETLAVRLDHAGSSFAYSADTGPRWSFEELGSGIDLAICEATALDTDMTSGVHLTANQAGEMARRAGVGELVLTHQLPGSDPDEFQRRGAEAYGSSVHIAAVGAHFHHET